MPADAPTRTDRRTDRLAGCLLGTAVGDAVGLPREGLSPRRAGRVFRSGPLSHGLIPAPNRWRGMVSDDTEQTALLALALLEEPNDPERCARVFARHLRWWLAAGPAGVGLGTLRAVGKLWLGVPPDRSGSNSAGNGAAMRAAILGVCLADDPDRRQALGRAAARVTHRDRRAVTGALLVADAAAVGAKAGGPPESLRLLDTLTARDLDLESAKKFTAARASLAAGEDADAFARRAGFDRRGVSGFVAHTVPAAVLCWLRHLGDPDPVRAAVSDAVRLGGDADSVAAITGGLAGATFGADAVPADWLAGLWDPAWPVDRLRRLADALGRRFDPARSGESADVAAVGLPVSAPVLLGRNALFAAVVLAHGFRRLAPPY